MKRIIAVFLVIFLALSVVGCATAELKDESSAENTSSVEESANESTNESADEGSDESNNESTDKSGNNSSEDTSSDDTPPVESWKFHVINLSDGGSKTHSNAVNADKLESQKPLYVLDTMKELEDWQVQFEDCLYYNGIYNEEANYVDIIEEYDEEYFETKSLLAVFVLVGSGTYRFTVDSVDLEGESLSVQIRETTYASVVTCDMAHWLFLIEVHDETLENYTDLNAYLTTNEACLPKDLPVFSYEEEAKEYKDLQEGVKRDGFVNTEEQKLYSNNEAISKAMKEISISWNRAEAYYDPEEKMYKIHFHTAKQAGGDALVYITEKAITKLIVFGE